MRLVRLEWRRGTDRPRWRGRAALRFRSSL